MRYRDRACLFRDYSDHVYMDRDPTFLLANAYPDIPDATCNDLRSTFLGNQT
jgi:hypothetical protein